MHKVVIERPRAGRSWARSLPRPKPPFDTAPRFESIKAPHIHRKWFSDLLGPLKRWLRSQTGRPWNDIYSEACAVIKPDSAIRIHVKTHLLKFVERHTFMHDGKVCYLDTWRDGITPITQRRFGRTEFFVHPDDGVLLEIPHVSKRARQANEPKAPPTRRWLRKGIALQQIRGLWFECHFEVVPVDVRFKAYDHALERVVSRGELTKQHQHYLLCKSKHQLSRKKLKSYGLQNAQMPGARSSVGPMCDRFKTALQISAGRRFWVIGHCRLAVQIRLRLTARIAQSGRATVLSKSFLVRLHFDGPKTSGYRHWFDSSLPDQTGE